MSGASKNSIFVMQHTRIARLRRLRGAGSHASAIRCGTKGLQQFVIERKHDSCRQDLDSTRTANERVGLGWQVQPTGGFFRNA